jgi:hypothetical protein
MISKTKFLAAFLSLSVLSTGAVGCSSSDEGTERWATTENTNVKIDWDKVNEAYKAAEGPEDLEKRINEIYEGDEVISVHVQDTDAKTQVVTGFFDKNTSGAVDEGEKIFTIKRDITGDGTAQYQTVGHGAYYGYHSPFMSIASGMLMGMMVSSMFRPNYVPMYTTPYATSPSRASAISSTRSSYRAANPSKFQKSQSGRSYGSKPTRSFGGGRVRGGGGFGLARAGRTVRPERLAI